MDIFSIFIYATSAILLFFISVIIFFFITVDQFDDIFRWNLLRLLDL